MLSFNHAFLLKTFPLYRDFIDGGCRKLLKALTRIRNRKAKKKEKCALFLALLHDRGLFRIRISQEIGDACYRLCQRPIRIRKPTGHVVHFGLSWFAIADWLHLSAISSFSFSAPNNGYVWRQIRSKHREAHHHLSLKFRHNNYTQHQTGVLHKVFDAKLFDLALLFTQFLSNSSVIAVFNHAPKRAHICRHLQWEIANRVRKFNLASWSKNKKIARCENQRPFRLFPQFEKKEPWMLSSKCLFLLSFDMHSSVYSVSEQSNTDWKHLTFWAACIFEFR